MWSRAGRERLWLAGRASWLVRPSEAGGAGRRGARQRGCRADGEDGWGMLFANRPVASEPVRARARRNEWWWVGVVDSLGEEGKVIGKRVIRRGRPKAGRETYGQGRLGKASHSRRQLKRVAAAPSGDSAMNG
jgi:hypothetical protein